MRFLRTLAGTALLFLFGYCAEAAQAFPTNQENPMKEVAVPFESAKAMNYLKSLCDIGPRISGSEGMKKQKALIRKHFEDCGAKVLEQNFQAVPRSTGRPVAMTNLVISWHPESRNRVIFCSHFDTRPFADQETDPKKRKGEFVSANDGGSGVALLMELGRHMKKVPCGYGVDFVFFDGEEYILDQGDEYFFGSKHFAREAKKQPAVKYHGAILLDMVGGKEASFPIEQNSWIRAGRLVESVWAVANSLGAKQFKSTEFSKVAVEDDHIPLNNAGIPAIDIIDFDYKHWHKLSDTPDNCSGETLATVAKVLSTWLQRLGPPP
ncbi:MAG: M28 family peptidase [Gemmataceae bacterium]|nr:M28 family peptidase [Gemmataceae bacterium]